jgi:hypothetical protein
MSARVRHRSRTASSWTVGMRRATSSPARCNRASRRQSRVSVLTRSPGAVGSATARSPGSRRPMGKQPGELEPGGPAS